MLLAIALCAITSWMQGPPAIATFDGVFQSATARFVEVRVEGGETMRMYVTRSTRFVRNGHPSKASEFHEGEKVTVDAERDARLNLLAVRVALAQAKDNP